MAHRKKRKEKTTPFGDELRKPSIIPGCPGAWHKRYDKKH